jgi:O-antigen/teichoic acid export membrane protein
MHEPSVANQIEPASGVQSRALLAVLIMGMRGATQIAKFALTLFIARFIDLETLGLYGLIVGLTAVLPVIAGLGLINCLGRHAVTQPLEDVVATLVRYLRLQGGIYGVVLLAGLAAGSLWLSPLLAVLIVLAVLLEHLNNDLFSLLNHLRQPRLANALMFVRSAGWIFLYMALAFAIPSLRSLPVLLGFWIAGSMLALAGFALATRHWPWSRAVHAAGEPNWLRGQFAASRLLYVNDVAATGAQFLDRYIVGLFMGLELTGVYFLFWSVGNAVSNLVGTGMIQVVEPHLIAAHKRQDGSFRRLFNRSLAEIVAVAAVLAVLGGAAVQIALPYLQRPLLADWLPALWLILAGTLVRTVYEVQGMNLYSRYRDHQILASGLLLCALSLAANVALVPHFALYGAVAAMILAFASGALCRQVMIARG